MQLRSNQRKKFNCTFLALTLREVIPLKKMGQNFHICLRSGPTGLTPPPPTVRLTIKYLFFYDILQLTIQTNHVKRKGQFSNCKWLEFHPSWLVSIIHAKSGGQLGYIPANFFGFSAKFQAENAKSIVHNWKWKMRGCLYLLFVTFFCQFSRFTHFQHHLRWRQHHLRWKQHHFRWKQHHFLSIFTIFCRFSRFTHFCRDLHFVAIYALFPQIFLAKIAISATSHVFCMYGPQG